MGNFFIAGEPAPQGSKTGRVVNGRVVMGLTEWKEKLQILSAHKLAISLEHFNQVVEHQRTIDVVEGIPL